ncbi:putative bifunctional diguanylate cyclase/phosphodiesterase [Aestuariirhabdus litorea]|uniref:cyclic-guanylate-specific phosphodiesterase n=1 Tax=Aestuariirhabdus litorea TaxID=2528527 RepID=A0A3P3VPJ9_9GAMM|nr:GGDEF domain-containing phosphodiesterase [Aestuariirhabdus litorea]RRJ83848.1 GGDEF domain-containing protein [Aestuariirhabdus litorea]RWW97071.1 EAL domain-containing protein [Endozoicomonadaceae bacterium GTF-13]
MLIEKRDRLSLKLLRVVLASACLVGTILSAAQIAMDAVNSQQEIDERAQSVLAMVRDPAIQAVYSLDREMAEQVVEGLFEDHSVRFAAIGHPNEEVLASKRRPLQEEPYRWLTDRVFQPERNYRVSLYGKLPYNEYYGDLQITLDTASYGTAFVDRAVIIFTSGILRAMAMAFVLYLIFTWLVTRPLIQIATSLAHINPDQPGDVKVPMIEGNERNELGLWVRTINQLLESIERNNSKRQRAEAHVLRLAQYDFLTGLPNRIMLQKQLQRILPEAEQRGQLAAVLCCGINDFKSINEQHTYKIGDYLLMSLADRLRNQQIPVRAVGRLGGDQFAIIQDKLQQPYEAAELAQSILAELQEPFVVDGQPITLDATLGIALFPADARHPEKLLQKAEQTMTLAKTRGNRYQFYVASVDNEIRERKRLERELSEALAMDQLQLVYQPQIDFRTGQVAGAEALLRWEHPEQGWISPEIFIPLAEKSDLIIAIGEWVLDRACAQLKVWHGMGFPELRMAVNLSAVQLKQTDLTDLVVRTLSKHQLPPQTLELEMTETGIMEDLQAAATALKAIKKSGVLLALDDFGTGYSSLSYLKQLPFDKIKIDKSFVQEITDSHDDSSIVRAIIQLGESLELQVIAEGVETAAHETYLIQHGCQEGQGYYYCKPVPDPLFIEYLRKSNQAA